MTMEERDFWYLYIKDTGDLRDFRRIHPKELCVLARNILKDYEYQ